MSQQEKLQNDFIFLFSAMLFKRKNLSLGVLNLQPPSSLQRVFLWAVIFLNQRSGWTHVSGPVFQCLSKKLNIEIFRHKSVVVFLICGLLTKLEKQEL